MNGLPYYKAYPRDFIEGTIGMSFELKGAYRLVLDFIYMQGGNLPDDPRYISGLLGCSVRKWKSIRNALIEAGKIRVSGEFLTNERAVFELETLAKLQDKQAENASGPRKNKDLEKPPLSHTEPEPEEDTLEASASNAADGGSLPEFSAKPADELWSRGVAFLERRGDSDKAARSFIGQCLRDAELTDVFAAFKAASDNGTHDPKPYILKFLQGRRKASKASADKPSGADIAAMAAAAFAQRERDYGQPRPVDRGPHPDPSQALLPTGRPDGCDGGSASGLDCDPSGIPPTGCFGGLRVVSP